MRRFSVSDKAAEYNDINIGISPGKFDTKQLILSSIAILALSRCESIVRFVRTVDKKQLSKCTLFINDDFTSMFPVIPSYNDIEEVWDKNCKKILSKYANYKQEQMQIISDSIKEKICNLEAIDCIMELYEDNEVGLSDSFEKALNLTLKLIEKFISDSVKELMFFPTLEHCIMNAKANYIIPPVYVQGWRSIVKNVDHDQNIRYAIFSENNNIFRIESLNKDVIMKKYVKGMSKICYSGRFFVKVTDIETAKKIINKLPNVNLSTTKVLA